MYFNEPTFEVRQFQAESSFRFPAWPFYMTQEETDKCNRNFIEVTYTLPLNFEFPAGPHVSTLIPTLSLACAVLSAHYLPGRKGSVEFCMYS